MNVLDNNIRNRLWTELLQARFNAYYADLYATKQRRLFKRVNLIILMLSTSGIIGWKIWEPYPAIVSILIAVISLIQMLGSNILPTNDKLDSMNKVICFYNGYFNQLEDLWYKYNRYSIDTTTMQELFYKIKDSERDISPIVDIIIGNKRDNKVYKETEKITHDYITKHF